MVIYNSHRSGYWRHNIYLNIIENGAIYVIWWIFFFNIFFSFSYVSIQKGFSESASGPTKGVSQDGFGFATPSRLFPRPHIFGKFPRFQRYLTWILTRQILYSLYQRKIKINDSWWTNNKMASDASPRPWRSRIGYVKPSSGGNFKNFK